MGRTRVFIAASLDGFIAGPKGELDWLAPNAGASVEDTFSPFLSEVGAMLMGRRTFDVVSSFEGDWPYGELPVLVASSRPLGAAPSSVTLVKGEIATLVDQAKTIAGEKDVYLDGGALIRSAMDAGLVDEITLTLIPMLLGEGVPLFAGLLQRQPLELLGSRELGAGFVELYYRPKH